jgi:hypothetical protein
MRPTLKKDYFSVPKGTVINVILAGTLYKLQDAKTKDFFALMNKEQLDEYVNKN